MMNKSINLIVIFDNLRDRIILPLVGKRANLFAGHPYTVHTPDSSLTEPSGHTAEVGGPGGSRPRRTNGEVGLVLGKEPTPSTGGVQHTWGLATRGPGSSVVRQDSLT